MLCVQLLKILLQHCSSQPKRGCAVVHAATWCRQQGQRSILTKKHRLVLHEQQRTVVSVNAARAERPHATLRTRMDCTTNVLEALLVSCEPER